MRQHLLECPGGPSERRSRSPLHQWSEPGSSQLKRRRPRDVSSRVVCGVSDPILLSSPPSVAVDSWYI